MDFLLQYVHGYVGFHFINGGFLLWLWQGFLVHLLVLVQRDGINLHGYGRHHIRWLLVEDKAVQCLDVHLFIADDVCSNEFSSTLFVKGLHGSVLDARELAYDCFHFFQLDTETANLYLTVATSYELDVTRREVAHDISRTINARILVVVGERILDIHFCCLFRTVQVTSRYLWTTDPQFSGSSYRQTVPLWVNDIEMHVVERFTDGYLLQLLIH